MSTAESLRHFTLLKLKIQSNSISASSEMLGIEYYFEAAIK